MQKIKITCDSTCDLSPELYEKYDISAIPLGVTLGDDFHHDGVDVTAQEIFSFVDKTGVLPKTSAISMGEYTDFFKPYLDAGYAIIHINISSDFSICYQNACLAARELGNVYPVDSRNLSTGSGHLALCAAEMAQQGMDAEAIAAELTKLQSRVDTSFVLQTLEYLKKGGRCSSVVALGANLLSLRPEIDVHGRQDAGREKVPGQDGKIHPGLCPRPPAGAGGYRDKADLYHPLLCPPGDRRQGRRPDSGSCSHLQKFWRRRPAVPSPVTAGPIAWAFSSCARKAEPQRF